MEFSREVYSLIVKHVSTRAGLLTLCTVSRRFQLEAQRALYNTLHLHGPSRIIAVCRLLSNTPRLSLLVEALSLFLREDHPSNSDSEDDDDSDESGAESAALPHDFWQVVASALRKLDKMRFFSVHFEQLQETAQAWILSDSKFQLQTFHCDFEWDQHLASFLRTQPEIVDLYLADYRKDVVLGLPCAEPDPRPPICVLPRLSFLECTFSEAAVVLVPGRPVMRVKTCFSRSDEDEKRAEMRDLLAKLKASRRYLCALDLADESYNADFSLELLAAMGGAFSRFSELRYLGTLALPVDGRKRVQFYGRLMRFPRLRCVEVEVSEWEPPPMTPAALRALTYELRIYCPSIVQVVFVYDFDRAMMTVVEGNCVLDADAVTETLWRDA